MKITVLGAGAWGTALAIAQARRHAVTLWARNAVAASEIASTRRSRLLPEAAIPSSVAVTSDPVAALADADVAIVATPVSGLRDAVTRIRALRPCPVVWACKGFEAGTSRLPHEVVGEVMGHHAPAAALSGPSFALEVAQGMPTAVTLAARDETFAREMALALHQPLFRVYFTGDLPGVEVGGAVKNVMAIATGICDGLGLGLNARAALITRGLAEVTRLGIALGGRSETFMGLAGVGDLILTCTGDLSRNRRVGLLLGEGQALAGILAELGHVAEGVSTAREVERLAGERDVDMPITRAVCGVLSGGMSARAAVETLLSRDPKSESADLAT